MTETSYAVIGGGIAGASVAYHLSLETDDPITVYERSAIGAETTAKSGATFGWYGDQAQIEMKKYAWRLYNEFLAEPLANPRYDHCGYVKLACSESEAARLRNALTPEASEVPKLLTGHGVDYYTSDELEREIIAPDLDFDAIQGGAYRPNHGYMDPVELTWEFIERARANGVRFETNSPVTGITTENESVASVSVDGESVPVDHVVCAAGPWNLRMAREVGLKLPVTHTLGPVLRYQPDEELRYSVPILSDGETGFFCKSDFDGSLLLGHRPQRDVTAEEFDPDAVTDEVSADVTARALDFLEELLPRFSEGSVVEERVGVRSDVADDRPVIGWTAVPNFSIVAFDSSGIQLAPMAGRIVARQLVHDDPTPFYDAVSISRFKGYDDVKQSDAS